MIGDPAILLVVFPLAAYLIGSTPFGVIIARVHGVDLRKAGSGNVGATNVARVIGRPWGYLCFFLDMAKGLAPALAACLLVRSGGQSPTLLQQGGMLAAGFGAIAGHVFSFYLGFRGGKGVATALGVVLGIYPYFTLAGLTALAIWIAVTLVSRYVSLGSIASAAAFLPLFALYNRLFRWSPFGRLWPLASFAAAMCLLIVARHRANIRRLLAGTENKIGSKGRLGRAQR